jgi:hypothetical protein
VGVTYLPRSDPRVRVLDELATRESLSLPHVYADGTLCLHESDDWSEQMFMVESIILWTAEWLVNYEMARERGMVRLRRMVTPPSRRCCRERHDGSEGSAAA